MDEAADPARRAAELREQLEHHNRLYYQEAAPEISDADYDKLFRELEELEESHPELADPNSPTQRVGGGSQTGQLEFNQLLAPLSLKDRLDKLKPVKAFTQVKHLVPMLSIGDVFELDPETHEVPEVELISFYRRIQTKLGHDDIAVTVEPKIDGVAVSLVYSSGTLSYAATRGDGRTGDDITHSVRTIRSVPLKLEASGAHPPPLLEIRGEIYIDNDAFLQMNEERDEQGLSAFANPRNAAAGALKQLDPRRVAERPLAFLAHGLGAYEGPALSNEDDFTELLERFQVPRNRPLLHAESLDETLGAVHQINRARHDLAYGTDGVVIRVFDYTERHQLGFRSREPRWAAAYKFRPEQKETRLREILVQVGRTGVLTPVADLEPVFVSGTTVSRATLHNQEEIERKDVRIGDTVLVEKAGEIIPQVVKVVTDKRPEDARRFSLYDHVGGRCPSCGGPIAREEGFVAWRCGNFECPAQAVSKIKQFASRKALDIEGVGEIVAEALVRDGHCTTPLDLFTLEESTLAELNLGDKEHPRRFGEKNAAKVIASLDDARRKPLDRWLFAMGIRHVGESASRELARLHRSVPELATSEVLHAIRDAERLEAERKEVSPRNKDNPPADDSEKQERQKRHDELKQRIAEPEQTLAPYQVSPDVGPAVAESVLAFFESDAGRHVLDRMRELGLEPESGNFLPKPAEADKDAQPLAGKTIVLTGSLSVSRDDMKRRLEALGAKVSGSVSGNTDYLLAGEGGGSKRDKAEKAGVPILSEADLESML